MSPRPLFLLILGIALGGCQSGRTPAPEASVLSAEAPVVAASGSSRDSWGSLEERLLNQCRLRQPHPGADVQLQILDQREIEQVTEMPMPAAFSGAAGPDSFRVPLPSSPALKSREKIKKLLGLCRYPVQP